VTTTWSVTPRSLSIEAETAEEATLIAKNLWANATPEEMHVVPESELADALKFYADADTYFAMFIYPDRPAGLFADDVGCCIGPHGDHDHRHGRRARQAMGDEWGGTQPCEDMLKMMRGEELDEDEDEEMDASSE
jgi:hypothetical protein